MSVTRILDHDPITNVTSYWHDDGFGTYTTYEEADYTPLFEQNQAIRRQTKRRDKWGPGKYVAEIPLGILYEVKAKGILDDVQSLNRWLDLPENMPFRTAFASLSR